MSCRKYDLAIVGAGTAGLEIDNKSETVMCNRGWAIVLVAFLTDALALGGRALFAVVLLYWEKDFGWTRSYISGSISLLHVAIALSTPVSGHVVDIFGARPGLVFGVCMFSISLLVGGRARITYYIVVYYSIM